MQYNVILRQFCFADDMAKLIEMSAGAGREGQPRAPGRDFSEYQPRLAGAGPGSKNGRYTGQTGLLPGPRSTPTTDRIQLSLEMIVLR